MSGVFQGIRVLDFGRFIAGPYCATLLGDMGAEVIRVERVGGGEDRYVAPVAESGEGGTFLQLNRNKKNIAVNPTSEAGREIVEKLIVTADVVVANLPRPTLVQMGLDYDSLKRIRPDIILATVSAFGSEGPYADRVGFDGVGQMMSGAAYLSGWPDRPVRWAVPYVDFATALGSAFGVSCALYHRQLTGEGQIVEGSLLRSALTLANSALIEQAVRGVDRVPTGTRAYQIGPGDIFRTSDDRSILVQVIGERLFARWARLMGEEKKWINDPRFANDELRGQNGEALSERMAEWCLQRTADQALGELSEARIPSAPMFKPQDVLDDPGIRGAGSFVEMEFPGLAQPAPLVSPIAALSETPAAYVAAAPLLGRDTEALLRALGYSSGEIERLENDGVVQTGQVAE